MLQICNNYSCKWRFEYNASKCAVIVFNESKNDYSKQNRKWQMGNNLIMEGINYTHLGIILNKYFNINDNVQQACNKFRSTILSICNTGQFNVHTLLSLYKSIVLPTCLYGCELWDTLSATNSAQLQRAQMFCLKVIQKLPLTANNSIVLNAAGVLSLRGEINYRKLGFLGQLVRLPSKYLSKQMFVHRIVRYDSGITKQKYGFIPDICRILHEYELYDSLVTFLKTAIFPSKRTWKSIVRSQIWEKEFAQRKANKPQKLTLTYFNRLFYADRPCMFWEMLRENYMSRNTCYAAVYILCKLFSGKYPLKCGECERLVDDIVLHRICFCSANDNIRKILWTNIIESSGMNGFLHLMKKDAFTQILDCIAGLEVHNASDSSSSLCTLIPDRSEVAIIHNMLSIHKSVN